MSDEKGTIPGVKSHNESNPTNDTRRTYEQEAEANFRAGRWTDSGATFEYLMKIAIAEGDVDGARYFAYRAGICWRNADDRIRLGILYRDSGLMSLKAGAVVSKEHVNIHSEDQLEQAKGYEIAGECFIYFDRERAVKHLKKSADYYKRLGLAGEDDKKEKPEDNTLFYMKKAVAALELIGEKEEIDDIYRIMSQILTSKGDVALNSEEPDAKQTAAKEYLHASDLLKKIGDKEVSNELRVKAEELLAESDRYDF